MEVQETEGTVGRNIFFWVFVGPLSLIGLFTFLFLYHPGTSFLLPTVIVAGFSCILFFRKWGFFAAAFLLLASAGYSLAVEWNGIGYPLAYLSAFLSYVIIYSSLQEADSLLTALHEKAVRHFEGLTQASEELELLQGSRTTREDELSRRLKESEILLVKREEENKVLENVQELANMELASLHSKQEAMLRENCDLRQSFLKEQEKAEEMECRYQNEKELRSKRDDDREALQKTLAAYTQEKELLEQKKKQEGENSPPNEANDQDYRKTAGLLKQLRLQFSEKSELLDQARKELFHLQEEKSRLEKEREEMGHHLHPVVKKLEEEQAVLLAENEALRLHLSLIEQ